MVLRPQLLTVGLLGILRHIHAMAPFRHKTLFSLGLNLTFQVRLYLDSAADKEDNDGDAGRDQGCHDEQPSQVSLLFFC